MKKLLILLVLITLGSASWVGYYSGEKVSNLADSTVYSGPVLITAGGADTLALTSTKIDVDSTITEWLSGDNPITIQQAVICTTGGISIKGASGVGNLGFRLAVYDNDASDSSHIYQDGVYSNFWGKHATVITSGNSYLILDAGKTTGGQSMYLDAGGYYYFRDQDASDATRLSINSSDGSISTATGSASFASFAKNTVAGTFERGYAVVEKTFVYDDSSPITIVTALDGWVVVDIWLEVLEVFVGEPAILQFGDGSDADGFATVNSPGVGYYFYDSDQRGAYLWDNVNDHTRQKVYTSSTALLITLSGCEGGSGTVYLGIIRLK